MNVKLKKFKIASINLFNYLSPPSAYYDFENIYSQAQWQKKQLWFRSFLSEHQPDIVGFQEVFSSKELSVLCKKQGLDYFAVVDKPEIMSDFIYKSPVVAIAARYPILAVEKVLPSEELVNHLGLNEFNFSRQVLRATIDLPSLGLCDFYVVHFKSKRANLDVSDENLPGLSTSASIFAKQFLGRWSADFQRGNEAALLFHAMLQRREKTNQAMILLGDFNDNLHSGVLDVLNMQRKKIHSVDIKMSELSQLPDHAINNSLKYYQLNDAHNLFIKTRDFKTMNHLRKSTHYYGTQGSVLDYILLSNEFDTECGASLAEVTSYETFDSHLINPEYDIDSDSTDHAPVMATITIRS